MSRDYHSAKGGRDGSKRRKFNAKQHARAGHGGAGQDGVAAWSTDSLQDFANDQAMMQNMAQANADAQASTSAATAGGEAGSSAVSSVAASTSLRSIDGSLLEGGGQVLRNAFAYAALLSLPVHLHHIRAGRMSGGGLKAQHLRGLELVHQMVGGSLRGAELHSREVRFEPGSGNFEQDKDDNDASDSYLSYHCDIATAGATGLLIQIALPVSLFLPRAVQMTLRGGTNASLAPVIDYSIRVFAPLMKQWFGIQTEFELVQRGFFPKGGGIVRVHTQPVTQLEAISVTERGSITKVTGLALVTHGLPSHIATRLAESAGKTLRSELRGVPCEVETRIASESEAPMGDGVVILLIAHTSTGCMIGASALGERGRTAEDVASACAEQLLANLATGGCVDEYMQDQVILYMALAQGRSTLKTGPLTMHTRTALFWAQSLTGCSVRVVPARGNTELQRPEMTDTTQTFIIEIEGIGYRSRFTQ